MDGRLDDGLQELVDKLFIKIVIFPLEASLCVRYSEATRNVGGVSVRCYSSTAPLGMKDLDVLSCLTPPVGKHSVSGMRSGG